MRKISNESSSSVREIKLFLCGEGTTDFGSEGDPDGPLQVVLLRTLQEVAAEELSFPDISVSLHSKYVASRRKKDSSRAIGRGMRFGAFKDQEEPRDMACAFAYEVREGCLGFFHSDVDFTHGADRQGTEKRKLVYDSIKKGIHKAGCWDRCRPVVPMPRTEAWLIYLADPNLTQSRMGQMKGNDKAADKNNPKRLLAQLWPGDKHERIVKTQGNFNYERLKQLEDFRQLDNDIRELLGNLGVSCREQD
ncbi:MAG TPA: hypothetical protein H9862_01245 [Candidatus Akkermansia intestinigallinarum]|uniref:Uncharacterized protein n=1 Tax=Candidatus Akkermansia intestinigallinarum TaxID=2838431 RepID=A0A9D1V9V9_9BACT|nr:hypothetical protein [Candidatus Akkermansia intestinigallinarum]